MRLTVMTTTTTTSMMMMMIMILMMTTRDTAGQLVQECRPINITSISVGQCGVWAVDERGNIFYLNGSYGNQGLRGDNWQIVPGVLKQLDVGYNVVWGVSRQDEIYVRRGITKDSPMGTSWESIPGLLENVSVSGNGLWVLGVNSNNDAYFRRGISIDRPSGSSWSSLRNIKLQQISIGAVGVWGVNDDHEVFYLNESFGGLPANNGWTSVPGPRMSYVSCGLLNVVGISEGKLYIRSGMSYAIPIGKSWTPIRTETEDWTVVDHTYEIFWGIRRHKIESFTLNCSDVVNFC